MFIMELFTRATDWQYELQNKEQVRASFKIEEYTYRVYIDTVGLTSEIIRNSPVPVFTLNDPKEEFPVIWDTSFSVSYDDETAHSNTRELDSITGTGNAIIVFSTVIDILQTTVENYDIQNLFFTADEPSRIKLYDRMSKHFASKGWRYIDHNEINARSDTKTSNHLYLLTKQPEPK